MLPEGECIVSATCFKLPGGIAMNNRAMCNMIERKGYGVLQVTKGALSVLTYKMGRGKKKKKTKKEYFSATSTRTQIQSSAARTSWASGSANPKASFVPTGARSHCAKPCPTAR